MAVNATSYIAIETGRVLAGLDASDSSADADIELYINAASEWIDQFCNRSFAFREDIAEKFAAPWGAEPYHYTKVYPIASVTSIQDTEPDTPRTLTAGSDYEVEEAEIGAVRFLLRQPNTAIAAGQIAKQPARGSFRKRYTITYDAGFETPNQSGTGALPLPSLIQMAARTVFKSMYANRLRDQSITREHLLRGSWWYGTAAFEQTVKTYLGPYARFAQA